MEQVCQLLVWVSSTNLELRSTVSNALYNNSLSNDVLDSIQLCCDEILTSEECFILGCSTSNSQWVDVINLFTEYVDTDCSASDGDFSSRPVSFPDHPGQVHLARCKKPCLPVKYLLIQPLVIQQRLERKSPDLLAQKQCLCVRVLLLLKLLIRCNELLVLPTSQTLCPSVKALNSYPEVKELLTLVNSLLCLPVKYLR